MSSSTIILTPVIKTGDGHPAEKSGKLPRFHTQARAKAVELVTDLEVLVGFTGRTITMENVTSVLADCV